MKKQILIIDYGSQYTLLIARTISELGYNCSVVKFQEADSWLINNKPKLVILSGGDKSVYAENAPKLPRNIDLTGESYSILGICYGMQLLAHELGGKVEKDTSKSQYGDSITNQSLLGTIPIEIPVWMSHGDSVTSAPDGFYVCCNCGDIITGIYSENKKIIGLQFHPEVAQTINGREIFESILNLSGCIQDWDIKNIVDSIREEIKTNFDISKKILLGLSGGVDSSVTAAILAPLFKENLHAIIIDHGGLRKKELSEAVIIAQDLGISYEVVNVTAMFLNKIFKIDRSDAKDYSENLRKVFAKDVYKDIFEKKVLEIGASYIAQGTNAADRTESGSAGNSALIKTHHNVGLDFSVKEILPIANLYKYQIREIGKKLGLSKEIYDREPFPGPGLYLRIVDMEVTQEALNIVREADSIVRSVVKKHELGQHISQLVVALLGCKVVGVKGDERTYDNVISVRAVVSNDFMTAEPYFWEKSIIQEIVSLLTKIPKISRVVVDYTPKPPGTTEYQ